MLRDIDHFIDGASLASGGREAEVFDPSRGFLPWNDSGDALPVVARSPDWYQGHLDPRPPALIEVTGLSPQPHPNAAYAG